jgi:hypothetical protein
VRTPVAKITAGARALPRRLPRGRRAPAAGALGGAALAVAAILASSGGAQEEAPTRESEVPTVELERRDLVARESVDGTLGFAGEADVINRLAGTITWLPEQGDVIGRGRRLFEVDGEPVLLMYGDVPAYRELSEGVSDGPDVKQLEANLAALGFSGDGAMTVDDEFTAATAEAVADWQDSLGLEETGSVELGRVVFMAGPRRVTSLTVPLGSDAGSGGSAGGATASTGAGGMVFADYVQDSPPSVDPEPEPDTDAEKPKGDAEGGGKKQPDQGGRKGAGTGSGAPSAPAVPRPSGSETTQGEPSGEGDDGGTGVSTEVMTTTSERRVVTVELDPADSDLARRGSSARVELPDGEEVKGRVASVGTVAESTTTAEGEETDPTIEVTISLPSGSRITGLDQAPVTVELTEEVRRDVFAVPVEALLGTAGDDYAIVIADAQGRRQVPVRPGLFADGYVEVEGDGLSDGAAVEVPGE